MNWIVRRFPAVNVEDDFVTEVAFTRECRNSAAVWRLFRFKGRRIVEGKDLGKQLVGNSDCASIIRVLLPVSAFNAQLLAFLQNGHLFSWHWGIYSPDDIVAWQLVFIQVKVFQLEENRIL